MSQKHADEGSTYRLTQRDPAGARCVSITVNSWDKAMTVVDSPFDHFHQFVATEDVAGREFVGIKENRHENGRFDIMVDSSGRDKFLTLHSYIEVREVSGDE
jgi:hypothetical protein